ncbi:MULTISPECIES: RHS repeat-associated core domain-containing protein [unclassified Dysgonomonas]|uniref:RHS repeat-associated core domain-containing protein n=1 Tax=unclassified Dysgonomonas TaxID=2630389 RepID=UPI002476D5F0|nr:MULTISPECIES: RHS repeat-associated core domain-containing protein [unclassified Dysgonomonas]
MKYCNGSETNYSYDQERRRLDNLSVTAPSGSPAGGGLILDNRYTYDKVDNVLSVVNSATPPTGAGGLTMGGQMSHTYNYDGLYRLTSASGTYTGAGNTPSGGRGASYTLEMAYDNLHNITSKKQHVEQKGIQFDGVLKAGYELAYNYNSEKPHQIANILDENYRTEGTDAKDPTKKEHKYEYDANGNLVYINTERPKKDGTQTPKSTERKLLWDEENRLEAIDDNGFVSNYWYDAAGERTVKTSGEGEEIYVNSLFSGGSTQTANFTAYVNPYIVVSKGGQYTKHIYIGSQRIVSKLGDLDSYGSDPRRIEYAGANVDGAKVDYKTKYQNLQQTIKDRYNKFEVPYHGKDNDDYVNGQGFCCDDSKTLKSFAASANDNPELFQYYYHSDHLGSSSLITNLDGDMVQHIEYVPFGEVFIEERNNTWNTPYLFNAKELDEETGLYYYGARYYDPRTSIWLSVDPRATKYPSMSPYNYCANNPINAIDLKGDTITLNYKTGFFSFIGIGTKHTFQYENGRVYQNGAEITGDMHSKLITMKEGLDNINSTASGRELLGTLESARGKYNITLGYKNSYKSGNITWNPSDRGGSQPNADGTTGRDPFIALAHELGHGYDRITNGIVNLITEWYSLPKVDGQTGSKTVFQSEKVATWMENRIRSEHGFPLRGAYSFDSTTQPWTPHNQGTILTPSGRTSSTINIFGKIIPSTAPTSVWDSLNHIPWRY